MILTIHPNWRNNTPDIPLIIVSGRNTANMVSVDAITEIATSLVANTAALFGRLPLSIWVVTFSNTTIASSTTIPIAIDNDDNEMILRELPVANR
jgi:hypothetical protein